MPGSSPALRSNTQLFMSLCIDEAWARGIHLPISDFAAFCSAALEGGMPGSSPALRSSTQLFMSLCIDEAWARGTHLPISDFAAFCSAALEGGMPGSSPALRSWGETWEGWDATGLFTRRDVARGG